MNLIRNWNAKFNANAYWDDWNFITLSTIENAYVQNPFFEVENTRQERVFARLISIENRFGFTYYKLVLPEGFLQTNLYYYVIDIYQNRIPLQMGQLVLTESFDECFYYSGDDLGATYSPEQTQFKVWAPTAVNVNLVFYDNKKLKVKEKIPMQLTKNGVWAIIVKKNCELFLYQYEINNNFIIKFVIDPYARAANANGTHSIVINWKKTIKCNSDKKTFPVITSPVDAIIYELSIRDFTDSGFFVNRGKFLGLIEENIKDKANNSLGLDYLLNLGITHVQILPIMDFATVNENKTFSAQEYNWGYDPMQYFCPEGSYATDLDDPYVRINELKKMINQLHEKKLRINLDVVFNHVYQPKLFSYHNILPNYFFRFDLNMQFSNGTGMANDIASERLMVRKFICDALKFWTKEYQIDGFRFDLMGIMDVTTMQIIAQQLKEINPEIMLYGEGWNLPTHTSQPCATMQNANQLMDYGFFNDLFRNVMKGTENDHGFLAGNFHWLIRAKEVFTGSIGLYDYSPGFISPTQSINYVEVHDNHTFADWISLVHNSFAPETKQRLSLLALAVVILSQGIPFIHCGQEFFRTKFGNENSYNACIGINRIDWNEIHVHQRAINFCQKLIAFRKKQPLLRLRTKEEIERHCSFQIYDNNLFCYIVKNAKTQIHVLINPSARNLNLPEKYVNWTYVIHNNLEIIAEKKKEIKTLEPFGVIVYWSETKVFQER